MKSKDVRLGNLVYYPVDGKNLIGEVTFIDNLGFTIYIEDLQGVFRLPTIIDDCQGVCIPIPIRDLLSSVIPQKGFILHEKVDYFHQFQNLYHSLYNEELRLKETD